MNYARSRRLTLIAAMALTGVSTTHAGPFQMNRVAADAQWLAHLDVQALANSQLVKHVLEHGKEMSIDIEGLDEIHEHLGIDPLKDLRDITAYGNGDPHAEDGTFVAIITATPAVDDLIAMLKLQDEAYSQLEVAGYSLQSFNADGHATFFYVVPGSAESDRVVVLSKSSEHLVRGLGVMEGKLPNLNQQAKSALAVTPRSGSYFFAASDGLGWIHGHDDDENEDDDDDDRHDPASTVMRDAKSAMVNIGEAEGSTFLDLAIATEKDETAVNLADLFRGLLAMGKLAANNDPELAAFKATLQGVKLTSANSTIRIQVEQKTTDIIEMLKSMHDKHMKDQEVHDDEADDSDSQGTRVEIKVRSTTQPD